MSPRYTITGGDRFHAQYRPSRRDHRVIIHPMESESARFINRNGVLIGACIAAVAAIAFCGPF